MNAMMRMFQQRRRYSLSELPDLSVLVIAMVATVQAWFWNKKTVEFGSLIISEMDKFGILYWKAFLCILVVFCIGFLGLIWSYVAVHVHRNLHRRIFPKV